MARLAEFFFELIVSAIIGGKASSANFADTHPLAQPDKPTSTSSGDPVPAQSPLVSSRCIV